MGKIVEQEEVKYKRKKEDAKPQPKDGGEEKYETKIYSISSGSGKLLLPMLLRAESNLQVRKGSHCLTFLDYVESQI